MKRLGWLAVLLAACGGGDSPADPDGPAVTDGPGETDGPSPDGPAVAMTLTSTAFAEGGVIPDLHTCQGLDQSPQLTWTNPPVGTLSFAMVLTDKTPQDFVHSVIYDIPANLTELPADIEKVFAPTDVPGAHQTRSFGNGPNGYRGPCPQTQHTYEFAVYALDVATLPGLTMNSTANQGNAAILMHDLAVARLTGTFDPN